MIQDKLAIEQVILSADSEALLLKISPLYAEITAEEIIALLKAPSLPPFKINLEGINKAVDAFAMLMSNGPDSKTVFEPILIAEKLDAQLNIVISEDKMDAYASITAAYGGKSITLDMVKSQCMVLGLKFGIVTKNVLGLLNASKNTKPGETLKIAIAHGVPAVNGKNASFVKMVNTESHRKPAPKLLKNGKVDMHDLGQSITVKAGTVLMKKIPRQIGTPGKTVTAETIAQIEGKDADFVIHKNVQIDPLNALQLIASTYGIPIEQDEFIKVDDVMLLEQVSNKTGNIIYDGTVVISGDIQDHMKVKASGDITVMGVIESADVSCGGDLTVEMPIIGHLNKDDGTYSCDIVCGGNLTGTIAQYANLNVTKNISLSSQLIHCRTECEGMINVHNESFSQGSIIGGSTASSLGVTAVSVGTAGNTRTEIYLTGNVKQLEKDKSKRIKEIQTLDKMINQFKQAEIKAEAITDDQKRKTQKTNLALEKQSYRTQSDIAQAQLKSIKAKLTEAYENLYLIATKTLFSETIVHSAGQEWCSNSELGPSKVSITNHILGVSVFQGMENN